MEKDHEGFIQRIGIFLMNSLACQVNDTQKEILGNLGIIEVSAVRWYLAFTRCETAWLN